MHSKITTPEIRVRRVDTDDEPTRSPADAAKPSAAATAIWDALTSNPGATAATIVTLTGVSRATVGRILSALEAEGKAVRTKGERVAKQPTPDTWHAVTAQHHEQPEPAPDPGGRPAGTEPAAPAITPAEDQAAAAKAAAIEQAATITTAIGTGTASLHAALDAADLDAALTHLDAIRAAAQNARQVLKAGTKGRAARTSNALHPGQLRDMVRDHLTAFPNTVLTPYQVGRAIGGRSSGAVANALDKLVEEGHAMLVSDHPRQYQHAESRTT
jgi:DeoR/GlpR family transcriptional regulator of sugar metabolism